MIIFVPREVGLFHHLAIHMLKEFGTFDSYVNVLCYELELEDNPDLVPDVSDAIIDCGTLVDSNNFKYPDECTRMGGSSWYRDAYNLEDGLYVGFASLLYADLTYRNTNGLFMDKNFYRNLQYFEHQHHHKEKFQDLDSLCKVQYENYSDETHQRFGRSFYELLTRKTTGV